MPHESYTTISLPKEMVEEIKEIIKENPQLGYSSVAEFIKASIRDYIRHIHLQHGVDLGSGRSSNE